MAKPLSVFELTLQVRELLEGSALLQGLWVSGEISNFKAHSSGHCYFTLKDERASLKTVMWRSRAAYLKFKPRDGMKVLVKGSIGVYERDGIYQLYADVLEPDGLGSLYAAYEQLKTNLESEGLFATARKRPLPKFPQAIGVITSPTGAAIRDILTILKRRYPLAQVLVLPVAVQGPEAVPTIVSALHNVSSFPDIDVVILGRGGGSIEDLWSFNEEAVARAIVNCACPVVSAVGHETDFTIADFVADLRAPTPSAAAELVVPDLTALTQRLIDLKASLNLSTERKISKLRQQTDNLALRLTARSPQNLLRGLRDRSLQLRLRLHNSLTLYVTKRRTMVSTYAASLEALSPLKVLARGYSVSLVGNRAVTSVTDANIGDSLTTTLADGKIVSVITGKENTNEI